MNVRLATVALTLGLIVPAARADYSTHPFLAPEERCGNLPGGAGDPDCQPLYWDFEAPTHIGETRLAIPEQGYPNGPTDRPVPMYFVEENGTRTMYERDTIADPEFPPIRRCGPPSPERSSCARPTPTSSPGMILRSTFPSGGRPGKPSPTTGTPGHLPKSPSDIGKCEGCSQAFPPLI